MVLIIFSEELESRPFSVNLGKSADICGSEELMLLFLEIKVFFSDSSSKDWILVEALGSAESAELPTSLPEFSFGLEITKF